MEAEFILRERNRNNGRVVSARASQTWIQVILLHDQHYIADNLFF